MSDLVKRLRDHFEGVSDKAKSSTFDLVLEAAARIEKLEADQDKFLIDHMTVLEDRIEALEADVDRFVGQRDKALEFISVNAARIEQLEAALREIAEGDLDVVLSVRQIARKALAQSSPPARLDSVEAIAKALLMEGRITPNTARALMALKEPERDIDAERLDASGSYWPDGRRPPDAIG